MSTKKTAPLPTAPGFQFKSGQLVSPEDSRKIVESRIIDESKLYLGGIHPDFASNTVEGPASIVELARALNNDPQKIYQFVHDNIEWEPGWGVQKGGLGALLDGMGNAFDQCMLMVQTLRQAGYTANYAMGVIRISQSAASAWFNTESTDIWGSLNYCANMNIPANYYWDGTNYWLEMSHVWVQCVISGTTYVFDPSYKSYNRTTGVSSLSTVLGYNASTFLSDAESGATIDGSGNYVQNMNRTNIRSDLATLAGNLKSWIETNNPTATVDNILGGQTIVPATIPLLQTALSYEKPGDVPTVWTGDVPSTYKTTLQVQFPDNSGGWCIDQTFTSDQLAGGRLTLFFNGSLQPVLYLNGTAVQTGIAQGSGTWNSVRLTVTHNAYSVTWYNQQWWQSFIYAGQYYLIANAWGNLGRGQADLHQKQLNANMAAGGASTSEPILGETLSVIWFNWVAQNSTVCDMTNRIMRCHTMYNHQVGIVYHNGGPGTDLGGISGSSTNLDNDTTKTPINDTVLAMHGVALEAAVLQQVPGLAHGVSATKVIDAANRSATITIGGTITVGDTLTITVHDTALSGGTKSDSYTVLTGATLASIATALTSAINADSSLSAIGVTATSTGVVITITSNSGNMTTYTSSTSSGATETIAIAFEKIYKATSSNWSSGANVSGALSANGYNSTDLSNINTWYISAGDSVVIADNPNNTVGSWSGFGYFAYPSSGAYGLIEGVLKGASPGDPQSPGNSNSGSSTNQTDPVGTQQGTVYSSEPIDLFSGAYTYRRNDLSIGMGDYPYRLSFTRFYDSRNLNNLGPLGLGWTHNFAMSASISSDGFLGMASQYALSGVGSLAEIFVCTDLVSDTSLPVTKLVTMSLANEWWIDQMSANTVVITWTNGKLVFTKQSDGTYASPPNSAYTLSIASNVYTLTDPTGNKMAFNADGTLASMTSPSGVSLSCSYSSGLLRSVSNNTGRTLTLNYTSGLLSSVTDGTRTVQYGYDSSNNLTTFTDATSQSITYSYDIPGRMTKFFKPANPSTTYVTNTYDSLGRVKTQANARNQLWTYFFAGNYTQESDPLGNTHTLYFNSLGSVINDIDALGNQTVSSYDGLNRLTQKTFPEGNSVQYTYDNNNNILTTTLVAKPGSGLSNILTYFTYDLVWAKVKTAKDGNGNTTTYGYDSLTGNLLTIQKPAVGGSTPELIYTYNTRGQMLTKTDETGIVTKYTYDSTTEELLSQIVDYGTTGHLNLTTLYGYDAAGNVNSVTDPNGNTEVDPYPWAAFLRAKC